MTLASTPRYVQAGIREARMLLIRNVSHHMPFGTGNGTNSRRYNPIGTPITQSTVRARPGRLSALSVP
jgi:hypothetical protein